MIFTLVEHCHLKKKVKGVGLKVPVLVSENGAIIVPQHKVGTNDKFEDGQGRQSFDIRPEDCTLTGDFDGLSDHIAKSYDRTKALKMFSDTPSLTVRHVMTTLGVQRQAAKELVNILLQYKAYVKYFSYWRRTKEFTMWLLENR